MKNKLIPILVLLLLLVVFTFTYGVAYFPILNADNAIQVIMIDHLSLPKDLYYMGQDRIGSIIPMMGWGFYNLGASSIWAVTLSQLLIFLIAGLVMIRLYKNAILALTAIALMLFPLSEFESQVLSGHPYLGHILVLFAGIWAFKKYGLQKPIVFAFVGFGMWASGIFAANIAAAGLIYLASGHLRFKDKDYWKWVLKAGLWALPGFALLILAKNTATTTDNNYTHSSFVSFGELGENIQRFGNDMWHFLSFDHPDFWLSISLWLFLLAVIISIMAIKKNGWLSWSSFFILSGIITIVAILLSEWAYKMGLPRRYFSIAFIQVFWGLLLAWDNQTGILFRKPAIILMALITVPVALSGVLSKNASWRVLPDRLYSDTAHKLANAIETEGIMGSYWYVYLIEAYKPEGLSSMVQQNDINRDYASMKKFVKFDTITVIKNAYLPELKPSIIDHGTLYQKAGPTEKIDHVEFAKYYKASNYMSTYKPSHLHVNYGETIVQEPGDTLLRITPENFTGNNFAVFGPYLTLDAGTYRICYDLKVKGDIGPEAFIDVYRRRHPVKQVQLIDNQDNPCFEFTLDEPAVHVEMRVAYFGRGEIDFKQIHLKRISD